MAAEAVALVALIGAALWILLPSSGSAAANVVAVTADRGNIAVTVSGSGPVSAGSTPASAAAAKPGSAAVVAAAAAAAAGAPPAGVSVTPLVSGRVAKVLVTPGQVVRVRQPIALLTDPTAADAVAQARNALATASTSASTSDGAGTASLSVTLARQHLAAVAVPSQSAVTQARLDLASAKLAYNHLRNTTTTPPTPAPTPAALADARLAIKLASQKLDAANRVDPAALTQAKLDLANAIASQRTDQLKLAAARRTFRLAVEHQQDLTVRTPVAGTVTSVLSAPTAQVDSATPIISVADLAHLSVTINMSEFDVARIKVGDVAAINVAAIGATSIPGRVTSIAPVGVSNSGVVQFPVTVALNRTAKGLMPGMLASVQVTTAQRLGVVRVPLDAITYGGANGNTPQVTVLGPTGGQTVRTVKLGLAGPSLVQVVSGVKPGDRLAVTVQPTPAGGSSSTPTSSGPAGIGVPAPTPGANQGQH
jgi:HlyD family secretion protein